MPAFRRLRRALSAKLTRVTLDRFVDRHASTGLTLDIGAQTGPYKAAFPNRVAIDIVPRDGIAVVTDAQALGLASATFDVVLCTEVLEHIPEPQAAIDEMFRVLKPGGTLLLTTRFLFPIHDAPHDYFRFTKFGLQHLVRRFDAVVIEEETTTVGTLAVLVQRLGLQTDSVGGGVGRALWLLMARLIRPFSWLIRREYGDSRRLTPTSGVMTSGYHLVCRRPGVDVIP
jgi:SAM-dependent methyltransferase